MYPKGLRGLSTHRAHGSGGPRQQPSSAPPVQSTTSQQAFNPSYASEEDLGEGWSARVLITSRGYAYYLAIRQLVRRRVAGQQGAQIAHRLTLEIGRVTAEPLRGTYSKADALSCARERAL